MRVDCHGAPRSYIENLIEEWIFSERDRAICRRRILDGIRYEPLAEEFDLSVQRVKVIVHKCEETLEKHIE